MNQSFGKQLITERKKQGLTVKVIAKACGTSRSYITLIENDHRLPGKKLIPKIASVLNLKTIVVLNWYLENIREEIQNGIAHPKA